MVALEIIRASNAQFKNLPPGLVAVFVGATSGIGESTLKQFCRQTVRPRLYFVGRLAPPTPGTCHECIYSFDLLAYIGAKMPPIESSRSSRPSNQTPRQPSSAKILPSSRTSTKCAIRSKQRKSVSISCSCHKEQCL